MKIRFEDVEIEKQDIGFKVCRGNECQRAFSFDEIEKFLNDLPIERREAIIAKIKSFFAASFEIPLGIVTLMSRPYEIIWNDAGIHFRPLDENDRGLRPIIVGRIWPRVVKDQYLGITYYVIQHPESNEFFFAPSVQELLRDYASESLHVRCANRNLVEISLKAALAFSRLAPEIVHIYSGPYPDGWADGIIPYPAKNPNPNPHVLEDLVKFVKDYYGPNVIPALFNIAIAMAKVVAPAVSMYRGIFEDRILINSGPRRIGKSTLQRLIINALGLDDSPSAKIRVLGDDVVGTIPRIRNLLSMHMAPLFIDEVMDRFFEVLRDIILPIVTERGLIGVHARHYGHGFGAEFIALRSMIVNTNLHPGTIHAILGESGIDAYIRRIHIVQWEKYELPENIELPRFDGGLLGCIIEIWNNTTWRSRILNAMNIYQVAMILLKAMNAEYGVDVRNLEEAILSLFEEWKEEAKREITWEEYVVQRAYEIARKLLGVTNITAYDVVMAVLDNPWAFDIKFVRAKWADKVENERVEIDKLRVALGVPEDLQCDDAKCRMIRKIYDALGQGYYAIAVLGKSTHGLLPSEPRKLFNHEKTTLSIDGHRRPAYVIPLHEFVKWFIEFEIEIE